MSTDDSTGTPQEPCAQEKDLLAITDAIPIGITVLAPDGAILYVNQMSLDRTGLTLDEIKAKQYLLRTGHPDDVDRALEKRRLGLSAGVPFLLEMRLLSKTGEYRWHVFQYNPLKDESGRIIRWYLTDADIDDRKSGEQRLRESEAYLAEAQRLSQTGSWAWNPATGDIRYWSEMCYRVLGFDPASPPPRYEEFFQRLHPDDQAASRAESEKVIRDKADFEWDYRIVHPEKGIRDIHAVGHAVLDGSGNLSEYVGTVIDVTERKRAEQELRKSEEDLRTITDTIRQPISVLAPDGTMLYANRVALDNSGLTLDEVIKEDFIARVVHPDDVNRVRDEHRIGLLEGVPFDLESRLRIKSGNYRWQLIQYNPLKDESGQIIRWYVTVTDIDDRKRAEEQVEQA